MTSEQIALFEKICRQKNSEQFEAACDSVKRRGEYPADWFEKIKISGMADFFYFPNGRAHD